MASTIVSAVPEPVEETVHTISIVVPVYRGETTLERLISEIEPLTCTVATPAGRPMRITEALLVHDGGPDRSDVVIRRLAATKSFVRPVWLSTNFGQHAATIAGMSSTGSEWIATIDEDGQFAPGDIGKLLDQALDDGAQLVYGQAANRPPHGPLRNAGSRAAKFLTNRLMPGTNLTSFSSFRLMLGEIGRGIAAYVGPGVYLDVALSWAFGKTSFCPVDFRDDEQRTSGYTFRKLLSHFWVLVITVGPRPLRLVSFSGVISAFAGIVVALVVIVEKLTGRIRIAGWSSIAIIILLLGGVTLFALGVIAEYVGAAVRMAMGKPLYLITSDPANGPLHRSVSEEPPSEETC
jgi:glycosyltransferase involved in cell wall biosynthesis